MGRGYNHWDNCTCRWCNNYGGYSKFVNQNELYEYLQNEAIKNEKLSKLRDYFSYTNPNAICPICKGKVYFYQNSYGSRVYFDELGKPWPKHRCFIEIQNELVPDYIEITGNEHVNYSQDYYPVQIISKYKLVDSYYVLEVSNFKNDTMKFVINNPPSSLGLTYLEMNDKGESLSGYDSEEYSCKLYPYSTFITEHDYLFPYVVGSKIEITIDSKNEIGMRTEIFINKPIHGVTDFKYRLYIYTASLSEQTKRYLKEDGVVRIQAISRFTRDNEVIFTELM